MTARQVYEAVLIELNKLNAPSLLLEDFNYLFNKAINLYINRKYNVYDVNQQSTDDLRVLKSTAMLTPKKAYQYTVSTEDMEDGETSAVVGDDVAMLDSLFGATYEVNLPDDYLHLLNCICVYKVHKTFKCYNKDSYVLFGAERLTADIWGSIINNFYMKPSYKKPYYYIHNVNYGNEGELPTNGIKLDDDGYLVSGTDLNKNSTPDVEPEEEVTYTFTSSATSATWNCDLYGTANAVTFTITSLDSTGTVKAFTSAISSDEYFTIDLQLNTITVYPKEYNDKAASNNVAYITLTLTASGKTILINLTLKHQEVYYYAYYGTSSTYNDLPTDVTKGTGYKLSNNTMILNQPSGNIRTLWVSTGMNTENWTATIKDSSDKVITVKNKTVGDYNMYYLTSSMALSLKWPLTVTFNKS